MILFINTVSKNSYFWLFDMERNLISEKYFEIKWNESSQLLPNLDAFLKENNLNYFSLENIVFVNWPGSFTWVRTVVLAVNTINFIINKNLTPLNFFELFNNYPIIKSSSKRDSFFKKDKNSEVEILTNDEIISYLEKNNIKEIFWDANLENTKILEKIDYCDIIKHINLQNLKKAEALYIKKPNIC